MQAILLSPLRDRHHRRLTHDQYRAGRQVYDFFCHAAQEHVVQSRTAMRPHHNEIDLLYPGRLENFLERHAVDHGHIPCQSSRSDTLQISLHAVRDLCFQVLEKRAIRMRKGDIQIDATPGRRLNHMEESQSAPSVLARRIAYSRA